MLIDQDKTVKEIQEEFNMLFPGLQIHFYSRKHLDRAGSPESYRVASDVQLKTFKTMRKGGFIPIYKTMSVSELEQTFESRFGLHIQVFRQSNDLWLQTTSTDNWTLEEQNRKGINSNQKTAKNGY